VERRRQVKGPRILGRYDPKIEKHRISKTEEAEHVTVAVRAGVLLSGRRVDTFYLDPPSPDQVVAQRDEPVKVTEGYWLYRDYWIAVEDERSYRSDEIMLLIKRAVLREERELLRARQEVEALERLGDLALERGGVRISASLDSGLHSIEVQVHDSLAKCDVLGRSGPRRKCNERGHERHEIYPT